MAATTDNSADAPEVTITQALVYAIQLQQHNELDSAEEIYRRILEAVPEQGDALHFLGVLQSQRGKRDAAITLIRRACELIPNHADCYINLGNVLADSGRLPEAATAYHHALALAPERGDVFNNLGVVFKLLGRWEEAETSYLRAIELEPDATGAYNNLGLLHASRGHIKEAVHYYCLSIDKKPDNPDSRRLLGVAYYSLGRVSEAAEVFEEWMKLEPDSPVARHLHAACSGDRVPDRAADDYVEQTFDRFADSFDSQLQGNLSYRAPELVVDALERARPDSTANLDILDAGCGTGLCGPLLRPYARQLSGVDLSGGMLIKADARQCYDALTKGELTAFIAAQSRKFDLIISADTLVYFGPLEAVFAASRQALRAKGLLIFTVEQLPPERDETGFAINPHGRYAHGHHYLETTLIKTGFELRSIDAADLRTEGGKPVKGWVVTAQVQ